MLHQRLQGPNPSLVRVPIVLDPDESELRELFMPPALLRTILQNDPKRAMSYCADIRAFFGRYIKGGLIDNQDYMKSWKHDVFELRLQNQRRSERIRIFGAFGRPDTFIALFHKPRSYFGGRHDPHWDEQIYRAIEDWEEYFPGCGRGPALPFANCVTFNYVDVFERGSR
jgi:hypothetical protein